MKPTLSANLSANFVLVFFLGGLSKHTQTMSKRVTNLSCKMNHTPRWRVLHAFNIICLSLRSPRRLQMKVINKANARTTMQTGLSKDFPLVRDKDIMQCVRAPERNSLNLTNLTSY